MPSVIEPSGDGDPDPEEVGEGKIVCSDRAVVADALAAPGKPDETLFPNGGLRPAENLEDDDIREALEPGRIGEGIPGTCVRGTDPVWIDGEGGGGGEVVGDGVRDLEVGIVSRPFSTGAWAKRRDSEEGPAVGEEFARVRTGLNKWGGLLTRKESSTSACGGSGGMLGAVGGACSFCSLSAEADVLRDDILRLFDWLGCVQSSTSNM